MIAENFQPKVTHAAALEAMTASLLMSASGASGNPASPQAATRNGATSSVATAQTACATLSGKAIGGATLTTAVIPASGTVPTYCKVYGTLAPALNFEIRLPDVWNGKLYYAGGGGYDGSIPELVVPALTRGYAEVVSDSGHQGDGMSAAFTLTDTFAAQLFGSLSVPTVMSTALKIVTAAYGAPPAKSYFEGCSNGGREALMAVQRNPNLFDGVIARSPGYNWVGFMGAFNRTAKALAAPGGAFSPAKTALLAKHVRDACDGLDGIVDGVVANPAACTAKVVNLGRFALCRRCRYRRHLPFRCATRRRQSRGRPTQYSQAATPFAVKDITLQATKMIREALGSGFPAMADVRKPGSTCSKTPPSSTTLRETPTPTRLSILPGIKIRMRSMQWLRSMTRRKPIFVRSSKRRQVDCLARRL